MSDELPIRLPKGWRKKLRRIYQHKWKYQNEADFLADTPTLSRKTLDRAESSKDKMSPASFDLLVRKCGYQDRPELLNALNDAFSLFGEIKICPWQEIGSEERPWPFPPPGSWAMPPFPPKENTHYVSACNICLKALTCYDLKPLIRTNPTWHEIEIVLYQCVPRASAVDGLWKRMASFGAVSSGKGLSQLTPEGEHWLVTCWGKHRIARDEPWWPFVPIDCTLDKTRRKLTASFAPTAQRDVVAVLEMLADSEGTH